MNEDLLDGEPLPGKTQKVKTQKQRITDAAILSAQGHLVSPLGKPKKKGSKLTPSRSHPIKDVGNVTIPQLWATYVELFGKSFGLPDLLPQIMANTKENVSRYFDDMRQCFFDTTGSLPDNRDLYEYLIWFHKPERLKGLFNANKVVGSAGYVHPNQLKGVVHIKRFHDEVLVKGRGKNHEFASERVATQRKMTSFVLSAYEKMRKSTSDNLVYCLVDYGYVLLAEYFHDYNGSDPSACRERIINMMVALLKAASDKRKAIEFLNYAWTATETNEKCFTSAVWPDWRESCKDMLDVAVRLSEN